jgi:hypothetical protein
MVERSRESTVIIQETPAASLYSPSTLTTTTTPTPNIAPLATGASSFQSADHIDSEHQPTSLFLTAAVSPSDNHTAEELELSIRAPPLSQKSKELHTSSSPLHAPSLPRHPKQSLALLRNRAPPEERVMVLSTPTATTAALIPSDSATPNPLTGGSVISSPTSTSTPSTKSWMRKLYDSLPAPIRNLLQWMSSLEVLPRFKQKIPLNSKLVRMLLPFSYASLGVCI